MTFVLIHIVSSSIAELSPPFCNFKMEKETCLMSKGREISLPSTDYLPVYSHWPKVGARKKSRSLTLVTGAQPLEPSIVPSQHEHSQVAELKVNLELQLEHVYHNWCVEDHTKYSSVFHIFNIFSKKFIQQIFLMWAITSLPYALCQLLTYFNPSFYSWFIED